MRVRAIIDTNFQDYKKCSMFIATETCSWKCCKEAGCDICQNMELALSRVVDVDECDLAHRYVNNPLTSAVVIGGLEPFDSFNGVVAFIRVLRRLTDDDVVIYTGYNKDEIEDKLKELSRFSNIIIKFGRFIPNDQPIFDPVLGVWLASQNQYAWRMN